MERSNKDVGLRLRLLREALNLSQAKLAKKLKVSQGAISKWESGERDVPTSILIELKKEFGVNLNWLLSGEGEMFSASSESANLTPELVDFFKQIPPEVQRKFVEFFKDTLEFLSKSSQTSFSHKSKEFLKSNS